jgi:hypothetical protein
MGSMSDEKRADSRRLRAEIIRSGEHGGVIFTREVVEDILAQIESAPKPVNIEHDPTVPPVGRMRSGRLIELPDGELSLEAETELFEVAPVVFKSVSELQARVAGHGPWPAGPGPLKITTDARSYTPEDTEALRRIGAEAGTAEAADDAMRFSVTPDALLVFGLGPSAAAAWWFSKGFFNKLGEKLADEVGDEMVSAWRRFRDRAIKTVERREPADRPPITLLTFELPRPGGGVVAVEGSTRGVGEELRTFLDAGSELLPIAQVHLEAAPESGRLAKMHFAHTNEGWRYVYGLDDEALPVMIVVLSEADYAEALARAEAAPEDGASRAG